MKSKFTFLCFLIVFFGFQKIHSQGYQEDSLQIKIYTTLIIDEDFLVEVSVRKVFCEFCNEEQKYLLSEEAKRRTFLLKNSPEYFNKQGKHKMALYIRMSKEDFKNLKIQD